MCTKENFNKVSVRSFSLAIFAVLQAVCVYGRGRGQLFGTAPVRTFSSSDFRVLLWRRRRLARLVPL